MPNIPFVSKEIVTTREDELLRIPHLPPAIQDIFRLKDLDQETVVKLILKELIERADEGGRLIVRGTVATTVFTIIDTQFSPGHPVKGYTVENTGTNPLIMAHNAARTSVGPDISDVAESASNSANIWELLAPGDITEANYNKNKVSNIYLLAQNGSTSHKTKLVW